MDKILVEPGRIMCCAFYRQVGRFDYAPLGGVTPMAFAMPAALGCRRAVNCLLSGWGGMKGREACHPLATNGLKTKKAPTCGAFQVVDL